MVRARGFTLLELLAVLIVLAVIAGITVPRFMDMEARANGASEVGTVKSVKSSLLMYRVNGSAAGTLQWPSSLDSVAADAVSSPATPFFSAVLQGGVDSGWTKGGSQYTYVSPAGNTFVYDPNSGFFGTVNEVSGAAAVLPGGGTPALTYTNMTTWTASGIPISGLAGAGYALSGNDLMLSESWPSFTEASRRVALAGGQQIQAGTYSLNLDTALTDYYNQLNYWIVVGVKNGTTLNLSGDTLRWNSTYPGVKYLHKDYAPPAKSDGTYYNYNQTFTVSAADAAEYDQIVVVMAGSRFSSQMLGWRNVSLQKQ